MKLKLDDKGQVVVVDGKPVYTHDDGKDVPFDAPGAVSTISRLNGEAKTNREGLEAATAKLKAFEGIEDVAGALKAIETMKNIDDKKLVDAGKVEEVKRAAVAAAEEKAVAAAKTHAAELKVVTDNLATLTSVYNSEKISGMFKGSKFIIEKVKAPVDLIEARFSRNFKVEDGKLVGYDNTGNKIYSRAKPGEVADAEEAIEHLIEAYPNKDDILKGTGSSGSDNKDVKKDANGKDIAPGTPGFGGTRTERTAAIQKQFGAELAKVT